MEETIERLIECRLITNGYLLFTTEYKYHVSYADNTVELLMAKPEMTGDVFPIPVINSQITEISEEDNIVTLHTTNGLLTFEYNNNLCTMKLDNVQLHQFEYKTTKQIYFDTYTGPYKMVYISNLDKPYKLDKIYNHIYFDGYIESFNPIRLYYIVNEQYLAESIKVFSDTLDATVVKVVDHKQE